MHHAHKDFGAGYCVFNDVAVACTYVVETGLAERILIVDVDVHQGDGTAAILANEDRIYTFSIHCENNFPSRKQRSNLDIGLPDGTGDAEYARHFQDALRQAMLASRPEMVLYVAGADPYEEDRLGRLKLSLQGLRDRDEIIISACRRHHIPLAIVMGGGYADDVNDIIQIQSDTVLAAASLCNSD